MTDDLRAFDERGGAGEGQELLELLASRVASSTRFRQAASKAERARLRRELGFPSPVASVATAKRLVESSAILASSRKSAFRQLAYRTAINIHALLHDQGLSSSPALRVVLTRLGNFAALEADPEVWASAPELPLLLALEETSSAQERTVHVGGRDLILTDFQLDLWSIFTVADDAAIAAPTSAGKSFVLQNFLNSRFSKATALSVVYIVPTRALISQVAQDFERATADLHAFRPRIIHVPPDETSALPERAIYVFTPERLQLLVKAHPAFRPSIVIVDEAHLLGDGARGILLQWVLGDLISAQPKPQILFASPTISNLDVFGTAFALPQMRQVRSTEPTVAQNIVKVKIVDRRAGRIELTTLGDGRAEESAIGTLSLNRPLYNKFQKLAEIPVLIGKNRLNIVYVNGADDAEKVALRISALRDGQRPSVAQMELAQLARDVVHPRYALVECLLHGVAYHYSNIPPSLRSKIEQAFAKGDVEYMVCTSTLLQGVNSPAHNIFMFCPEKGAGRALTSVDFWNLAGRAGRLRREFQGNIFLIDYGSWKSTPLSGSRETTVVSALRAGLIDTTDLISVVEHHELDRPRNRLDLESTFSKLLVDYRRGRLEDTFSRAGVASDAPLARRIKKAVTAVAPRIAIPDAILEQSPNVSPHKQQRLYEEIRRRIQRNRATAIMRLSPRHPWDRGAYQSYDRILRLCYQIIWERPEGSRLHRFHALLALWWMRGYPLPKIISRRLSRQPKKEPRKLIRETLALIEDDIRFKAVRVFTTYNVLLELAYVDERLADAVGTIQSIPLFLELGASDRTMISFMELGLSRPTSVEFARRTKQRRMGVDEALEWLRLQDPEQMGLSSAMTEELIRVRTRRAAANDVNGVVGQ